jgi:LPS-assembly lipoprotein
MRRLGTTAFAATAAGLALLLGGCGFTPLYATPGVPGGLSSIQIVAPQGRVAYLLREDLDDALAHDKAAHPAYRLDFTIAETRGPRGLSLEDVAQRYELALRVRYTLTRTGDDKPVHSGEVMSQVSYDAAAEPYAGIAARQDTQERAAADAARRIQIELAAWLARHPPG